MSGVMHIQNGLFKFSFTSIVLLMNIVVLGQGGNEAGSDRIADCFGAVALPNNGQFSIAFPEDAGIYLDLDNFEDLTKDFQQKNSVWLKFEPGFKGNLDFKVTLPEDNCHLVVFDLDSENACDQILKAKTDFVLDTMLTSGEFVFDKQAFLNRENPEKALYLYFNYAEKHRKKIFLESRFKPLNFNAAKSSKIEKVDQRSDKTKPTYQLSFRDVETGLPVTARAIIKESRMFDAMYNGSDLFFSLDRRPKFFLRIDAIGYFPLDTNLRVSNLEDTNHEIFLEPVAPGKQMSLEGIEFLPETADFVAGAQKKLKRIRDFLALNADLKIEVQGHVHQIGENNFWSKRLSRLRAKAVADYLVNAGIEESRIEYNGYGNTEMVFPEPENDAQMQANRRVEIHIK